MKILSNRKRRIGIAWREHGVPTRCDNRKDVTQDTTILKGQFFSVCFAFRYERVYHGSESMQFWMRQQAGWI